MAGYDSANLAVYRLDDGGKVLVRGTVENGYYTVITKTAGAYTLVEKGSTITDAENTENAGNQNQGNTNIPQTGDTSNIAVYVLLALAAAGMMGVTMAVSYTHLDVYKRQIWGISIGQRRKKNR